MLDREGAAAGRVDGRQLDLHTVPRAPSASAAVAAVVDVDGTMVVDVLVGDSRTASLGGARTSTYGQAVLLLPLAEELPRAPHRHQRCRRVSTAVH